MLLFLLIIVAVAIGGLVKVYNTLQSSMQSIREGFSNLQAGLKKRQQLSGQIIEIASGYLEHEQITQLKVAQANNTQQMMAMAQSFPQLKADATYQKLMGQLERLENEILERREGYNNRVRRFNSYRGSGRYAAYSGAWSLGGGYGRYDPHATIRVNSASPAIAGLTGFDNAAFRSFVPVSSLVMRYSAASTFTPGGGSSGGGGFSGGGGGFSGAGSSSSF